MKVPSAHKEPIIYEKEVLKESITGFVFSSQICIFDHNTFP
jgi:hypothetical protein